MTTIVTRAGKGSPLTHTEVDTNFTNLNTAKLEAGAIALGSAGTPSISFVSDANTGIFSPGADQVAVSTGGVQRINIEADGDINIDGGGVFYDATNNRLAIGTTTPSTNLHVRNSSGTATFLLERADAYPGTFKIDASNDGVGSAAIFTLGSTERMRIDGSGRLLVGTPTDRSWAGIHSQVQIENVGSGIYASQSIIANSADTVGGLLALGKSRGTSLSSNTAVQSNDLLGRIYFVGADGSNLIQGATITAEVDGTPGANDMPGRLVFSTTSDSASSPTERMRIDNKGGLYIGPAGDYANSNYSQSTGNGNFYYRRDNGSEAGSIIVSNNADRSWALSYLNKFAWDSGDDSRWIAFYLNGVTQDSISWTGSAISYGTSSDYRRKTNPSTYAGGLEKVKQLHVREYEWVEFPEAGKTVGFFAHELQEIFPQAVTGVKDGMKIDEFSGEEVPSYQGIDYGKITPLLAAALQEAIAKIETLEARLTAAGI